MNPILQEATQTQTPYGTAALWWLGQMGLLIRMGSSLLLIDYYASDSPDRQLPPPIPARELTGIQAFLGTHNHLDHIDHEAWKVLAQTCPQADFIFPQMHRAQVLADGVDPGHAVGMNDGGTVRLGDITVHAIAAAHEFLSREEATGLYPCLQYVIEGNGVRIYHAGDTLRYEGMLGKLQAIGKPDAALLPINGRDAARYSRNCIGNMTFQEAADLAGELKTGLAIPGHWDMFADNPGDPKAFCDYLRVKYGEERRCLIPEAGRKIVLDKNETDKAGGVQP